MTTTSRGERLRGMLLDRGGLLVLVTLVVYIWIAPRHIVDGDNAEFATLGAIGGTAHPTGYPLYLLWLRAMSWLPGVSPAHTAALATTLIGAATIAVLHAACRAWGARPIAATIAAAIFAGAPIVMRSGIRAEVFSLNCLVVATVLWLAANAGPLRGGWRVAALGLVAGLGISNHLTCVLVAPIGILGAVRGVRESARPAAVTVGLAVGGLVAGLLPYLYLFVTPETVMSWGSVRSLDDLYGMITRRDYGGPGSFLVGGVEVPATTQLAAFAMTVGRTWLWAPFVLGLATVGMRLARAPKLEDDPGETRWMWAMFAASWLAAGPLVSMKFNIEPVGLGLYVCQRFHVMGALLLGVPIAVGLTQLAPYIKRSRISERTACGIVATVGFLAAAGLSLPHLLRMHTPAVEQYSRNVVHSLPENAVLFSGEDDQYFGVNYVQWALGERQDVVLIAWQLTNLPWYARRLTARGIFAPEGTTAAIIRVVEYQHHVGHRVFVAALRDSWETRTLVNAFPTYPYGTVIEVLPHGTAVPPITDVVARNKALYEKFELGYARPGEDDEFATAVHHRYASTWNLLGRKLASEGKRDEADWAFSIARDLGPEAP